MILALVEIPLPGPKRDHDSVVAQSQEATRHFTPVQGLNRKYFLNADTGGAGVYEFATRADALAWFHDGWADWMEGRFGVRPALTLFDCTVMLDRENGRLHVESAARSLTD
jgi:hypothetical protein